MQKLKRNMSLVAYATICLLGFFLFQLFEVICGTATLFHFNECIQTSKDEAYGIYSFESQLKVSINECIETCKKTKACQFVNFKTRSHLCALIRRDKNSEPVIETKLGYVLGIKSEWMEGGEDNCEDCSSKGKCNKTGSLNADNAVCRNSGCGHSFNAEVMGNMFASGDKIILKCIEDFQMFPLRNNDGRLTCAENGIWAPRKACYPRITFAGSYYVHFRSMASWFTIQAYCKSLHGHLVDINTYEEQNFVETILDKSNVGHYEASVWFGGNDLEKEGTWRWSDNSEIDISIFWMPGNPDNWQNFEHCMRAIKYSAGWLWNDGYCDNNLSSVCEFQ